MHTNYQLLKCLQVYESYVPFVMISHKNARKHGKSGHGLWGATCSTGLLAWLIMLPFLPLSHTWPPFSFLLQFSHHNTWTEEARWAQRCETTKLHWHYTCTTLGATSRHVTIGGGGETRGWTDPSHLSHRTPTIVQQCKPRPSTLEYLVHVHGYQTKNQLRLIPVHYKPLNMYV